MRKLVLLFLPLTLSAAWIAGCDSPAEPDTESVGHSSGEAILKVTRTESTEFVEILEVWSVPDCVGEPLNVDIFGLYTVSKLETPSGNTISNGNWIPTAGGILGEVSEQPYRFYRSDVNVSFHSVRVPRARISNFTKVSEWHLTFVPTGEVFDLRWDTQRHCKDGECESKETFSCGP